MIQRYQGDMMYAGGRFVLYKDHQAELAAKNTKIDFLQKDNTRLYFELAEAKKEIERLKHLLVESDFMDEDGEALREGL